MSTITETAATLELGQERQHFTRAIDVELAAGDGRTLEARIVPYNVVATVADPPDYRPYREMFVPGAFGPQLRAPHRVLLNFEHEQGIRGVIGHAAELYDRSDGLHGTFKVGDNTDGEKALQLVNDGVLTGLSVEFLAMKDGSRRVDGIMQRRDVRLDKVSLCRFPAYQGAEVLAVRQKQKPAPRAAAARLGFDRELAARLARLGVEVPAPLKRMDAEDLSTLAEMIQLGTEYIADQDEPEDQKNIPVMQQALELITGLIPVEMAEPEPYEPDEDD